MKEPAQPVRVDDTELSAVDKFRRNRNTAVLTIMFTDIQGFTRLTEEKGDEYSNTVRLEHDGILVPAIEAGGAGQVIKHIGDAVMAVFAEPSAAVARALEIQEKLRRFNEAHADRAPLLVRIGLHMGQVTVEDKVSPDVFGRHMNRASRVEGLAAGGQVFLTYAVFDSAKGWLAGQGKGAAWTSHGHYKVKGIDEALEIFEVYDPARVKPRAPEGAGKKSSWPRLLPAAGLVLAGAMAVLGVLRVKRTTVDIEGFPASETNLVLDQGTVLQFDPATLRLETPIAPGPHLLYSASSDAVRHYAFVTVKRGANHLKPVFEYAGLPGLEGNALFTQGGKNAWTFSKSEDYVLYAPPDRKEPMKADLSIDLSAASDGKRVKWMAAAKVLLNGREAGAQSVAFSHDPSADEERGSKTIFQDDRHLYTLKWTASGASIQVDLDAAYVEPTK